MIIVVGVIEHERAARAELDMLPEAVRESAMAQAALGLARRLDGDPADTAAVLLARELRQTMAHLHGLSGDDTGSEAERFLAQIANPAFRNPGD